MLEDQKEETACMHVLGLLSDEEDAAFVKSLVSDAAAARIVREFRESLTDLHLSTTSMQLPPTGARERLLERLLNEPARVGTDVDGRVVSINPSFTALCGYRLHELIGKKPGHLLQGVATSQDVVAILRNAIAQQQACEVEVINYHKDGSPYYVRIQIEPVRNMAGVLTGFEALEKKLPMPGDAPAGC